MEILSILNYLREVILIILMLTPSLYCMGPKVSEPKKWLVPNFIFKGWEWCIWTITTIIHHQIWSADSTAEITVIQSSKLSTLRSTFLIALGEIISIFIYIFGFHWKIWLIMMFGLHFGLGYFSIKCRKRGGWNGGQTSWLVKFFNEIQKYI